MGLDTEGFCDIPMTAAWKMDCMAEELMQQVWEDKNQSLQIAIGLIKKYYTEETTENKQGNRKAAQAQIDRLHKRISGLVEMRADGDLSKEEYSKKRSEAEAEIAELEAELAEPVEDIQEERNAKLNGIIETLKSLVCNQGKGVSDDVIKRFVSKVVPVGNNTFEWYLDLSKKNKAKATISVNGRKNKEVIKLEEIIPISSGLIPFKGLSKNSPLCTTPHRLQSSKAGIKF